jgi:hypothetical protein
VHDRPTGRRRPDVDAVKIDQGWALVTGRGGEEDERRSVTDPTIDRETRQDVTDILVRYATGIDRRDWDAVPFVFHR